MKDGPVVIKDFDTLTVRDGDIILFRPREVVTMNYLKAFQRGIDEHLKDRDVRFMVIPAHCDVIKVREETKCDCGSPTCVICNYMKVKQ